MRRSSLERWGPIRQKGLRAWLRRGVLRWGMPMYLIMTTLTIIHHPHQWGRAMLIGLPIWTVGGVLWGALTWAWMDRLYRRHMRTRQVE